MSHTMSAGYETGYTWPCDLKKLSFIHRELESHRVQTILELGCGDSDILRSLGQYRAFGCEIEQRYIDRGRELGLRVEFGDATTFVGPDAPYDAVILSEVLNQIGSPAMAMQNVARNLKPAGLFVLTVVNGLGFYQILEGFRRSSMVRRLFGKQPLVHDPICQRFTSRQVLRLARDAGFSLVKFKNANFVNRGARDIIIADYLPHWMVSGWYFVFTKTASLNATH